MNKSRFLPHILIAINSEGKKVFIDDVPRGKKCNCRCIECNEELIARQGKTNTHHFAHANGTDNSKCREKAWHSLAEEIIVEEKRIPAFVNGQINFVPVESVESEKVLNDMRLDLYTKYNGQPIAIEIFVTHPIDDIKFNKIQNHKLTTFEINLSEIECATKEDVKKAIYDIKNTRPIYDEFHTAKALKDKELFINKNGFRKKIENGIVHQCPMSLELHGQRIIYGNISSNICLKCPFGYKKPNEMIMHCIGHKNEELSKALFVSKIQRRAITVNLDYGCQISVTEQRVVNLSELAEYFTLLTKQKFGVLKPRKKRIIH